MIESVAQVIKSDRLRLPLAFQSVARTMGPVDLKVLAVFTEEYKSITGIIFVRIVGQENFHTF
jgi:hypothetical protein